MEFEAKILIIDDEEIVLDSCEKILAGRNYKIFTAPNGTIGLERLEEVKPDLVFVDLKMPGISGFDVLERIQGVDPNIVCIVITGFATVSSAIEAMKKGAYDFLPKPFTPDELRLITKRGLDRRKLVLETIALRREKEMLRENFAAIISHELKSPLSAVQQNMYSLIAELSPVLSDDQIRRFERMKTRISDLLDMIRTWHRVFTTDLEAIHEQFKPTSISQVIVKAIESIEPHATRKDIEIITSIKEPINQVLGDEVTLSEAVINIGNNAVKYSHIGSEIFIEAEERNEIITISICDSGVGISEETLPYIFDDFYSGQKGSDGERGSGVGLAICRRIIEIHDGKISVDSKVGKGSTFEICLPVITVNSDKESLNNAQVRAIP
jgi:signal transduction histidine kinase